MGLGESQRQKHMWVPNGTRRVPPPALGVASGAIQRAEKGWGSKKAMAQVSWVVLMIVTTYMLPPYHGPNHLGPTLSTQKCMQIEGICRVPPDLSIIYIKKKKNKTKNIKWCLLLFFFPNYWLVYFS